MTRLPSSPRAAACGAGHSPEARPSASGAFPQFAASAAEPGPDGRHIGHRTLPGGAGCRVEAPPSHSETVTRGLMTPSPSAPEAPAARHEGACGGREVASAASRFPGWWHSEARALAETHTMREASQELGRAYETVRAWASAEGVVFLPPENIPAPEPVEIDDDARCLMLGHFYAAELGTTPRRLMDRRLWALTSRREDAQDVAAALAKLGAC